VLEECTTSSLLSTAADLFTLDGYFIPGGRRETIDISSVGMPKADVLIPVGNPLYIEMEPLKGMEQTLTDNLVGFQDGSTERRHPLRADEGIGEFLVVEDSPAAAQPPHHVDTSLSTGAEVY